MGQEKNYLGQFIPLHYHFQLLADSIRMQAFGEAINKLISSQHKVAELGSGTGVMSFRAARQGARVWAVEYNPALVEASRRFLKDNGVDDRVTVCEGDAAEWLPPEPVDWVICEMLHSVLLCEKQVQVIEAFRKGHQEKFGTVPNFIPGATLLGVQAMWQNYEFDGYYAPIPLFQSAYGLEQNCQLCSPPEVYKILDYETSVMAAIEGKVQFRFTEEAEVNALRFITKNILAMNMSSGQTIDWHSQHLIIPLEQSWSVGPGDLMKVSFGYWPGALIESLQESVKVEIVR